ncbi:neutral zinc metallopeptidase [Arachidicoccus ginsenosidivorans]|jgi:predicted metalloprotease|uniref:Metalloprotease n=1 Tax=Arachidicoccus ginsenosidivorans TaxID=496057 RepID=A0A5B8VPN5_9BACT|nr:neutral zinc metallopeptidase [Arachidicoccus ginsenosidivorans]QEC72555.1 metalloprotease [Arachidicoccus ginsenosidivorans]
MKWINPDDSTDGVEVRKGGGARRVGKIGGLGAVVVVIISLILGKNPLEMLGFVNNVLPEQATTQTTGTVTNTHANNDSTFTVRVYNSCNTVWSGIMRDKFNKSYSKPRLVMFEGSVQTACGGASAASGPFYCPGDRMVYIDLGFFQELSQRFNAPGDLAKAYVIAHEMGHHIQNLLGMTDQVDAARARLSEAAYNKLSVKLELQADFYAGLWAHYAEQENIIQLDQGDIESALGAAGAVGDDRLQKEATGTINPDTFTHGTSAQRIYWFKKGYTTGDFSQGDTFNDPSLN